MPTLSTGASPLPHVAALIERQARGRSVRRMELDAGIRVGALGQWVKPSTQNTGRMPAVAHLRELARALDVSVREIADAFALDIELPLGDPILSVDEQRLVDALRTLNRRDRSLAADFVQMLAARAGR